MRCRRRFGILLGLAAAAALCGAGCARQSTSRVLGYRQAPRSSPRGDSNTPEGKELADRLMLASSGLLSDACVLDNKHLYVALGPKVEPEMVDPLTRALILIMHQNFPEEDVAVHLRDRYRKPLVDVMLDLSKGTISRTFP